MMRTRTLLVATALLSGIGASQAGELPDDMCVHIATFANASGDATTHAIELKTDWGGMFEPKSPGQIVMAAKHCEASGYAPGQRLCEYLLGNTSTEFPEINLNRVLSCFGAAGPASNSSIEYVALKIWSYSSVGVRSNIRVGVEYSPGSEEAPPSMRILAEGLEAP
jgi:hypothetical protein